MLGLALLSAACRERPPAAAGTEAPPVARVATEPSATAAPIAVDLGPGEAGERRLAGGEVHAYGLDLAAGQFFRVVVDQRGVDVELVLYDPAERRILEVDSPTGGQGSEELVAVAEVAGTHRLTVSADPRQSAPGRYEVRLEERRPASGADRRRAAGALAFSRAYGRTYNTPPTEAETIRWAIDTYGEALDHFRAAGDRAGEARALIGLGWIYRDSVGDDRRALELFDQALPILRRLGDRWEESTIVHHLGEILADLGERQRAIGHFERALALRQELGRRYAAGATASRLGWLYQVAGESQLAFDYFDRALAILRPLGDVPWTASTLFQRSQLLLDLGKDQEALDHLTRALDIWRRYDDPRGQAHALTWISQVDLRRRNFAAALDHLRQAREAQRRAGDRYGEGLSWSAFGLVHRGLGDLDRALEAYDQALAIFRQGGHRYAEGVALHNLAALYRRMEEPCKAMETYRQAWELLDEALEDTEVAALVGAAIAEHRCGDLGAARQTFATALERVESLRSKTASYDLRASYLATRQSFFEAYVDLLMDLHRRQPGSGWDREGLAVSERARARSLIDSLVDSGADLRRGADGDLLARERELEAKVAALERYYLRFDSDLGAERTSTPEELARVKRERRALLRELDQVRSRIRAASPGYAALARPRPLDAAAIQRQVLDPETLLLQYALGERRSHLWAVTADSVTSYPLPGRAEIEERARRAHRLLTASKRRQSRARAAIELAELSEVLLGPVAEHLDHRRLLIAADGALHYVPFGALPAPAGSASGPRDAASRSAASRTAASRTAASRVAVPLIVDHEVVSVPSATALAVLRRQVAGRPAASGQLALVADPVFQRHDPRVRGPRRGEVGVARFRGAETAAGVERYRRLVYSGLEAEEILRRVPAGDTRVLLGFAATREAVIDGGLGAYRILHFATHGDLDAEPPALSRLVLSLVDEEGVARDNGFLFGHEIYGLELGAELVVLSACETALGQEVRGEGLVGLTQGFFYAGAERVVVSLWNVNDRATAELMARFYHHLLEVGQRPAAALRSAQVDLRKSMPAPYYWAGFVLQGEWR